MSNGPARETVVGLHLSQHCHAVFKRFQHCQTYSVYAPMLQQRLRGQLNVVNPECRHTAGNQARTNTIAATAESQAHPEPAVLKEKDTRLHLLVATDQSSNDSP